MVLFWHGWGIVILAIPIGVAILAQLIVESIYGPGSFAEGTRLYWPIIALVSAVLTWIFGGAMNREGNGHKLFFIPVQYWAAIWLAIGAGIGSGLLT